MRFLALTGLQGALLAVVTAAAIVALYFLKHRRRQVIISSTQLWKRVLENRIENSLFEKLRRYLSILLAVTTGLLVAMSIARPEMEWLTGKSLHTVIVLDTSPTMQARMNDGKTRWEHAVEAATAIVSAGTGSTQFRIADTSGHFDSPFTDNRAELRRLIERMHPVIAPTRFPDIDKAAANSPSKPDGKSDDETPVTFITDGVSPVKAPANATSISVFETASNVGITAFEVRSMPTAPLAYEAFLEARNSGKEGRSVEITISGAGQQRIVKKVNIAGGQSYKEALDLSKFDGGGIRAALRSDGDAFSPDDIAYAYLPVKRRTKTLLVTNGNKFLENALKLDRLVELSTVTPALFKDGKDFDALVFDRFAPPELPSRPALIIGAQKAAWLRQPVGYVARPRFESWMENHPVMQHVSLYDVTVDNAARIDTTNLSVLAASASDAPLIVASESPRWIQLTFDLQASDFPYHAGFPIFLDNAIAWFGRERLALRRAPGIVEIPLARAEVRTIDGSVMPTQESVAGTVFEASEPGLYVAASGDVRQYIAVNFANREFSDINNSHVRETTTAQEAGIPFFRHELWFYMLCGALLLIGAEWFTYHRRITL
jgi:Aerotolerance regulator N-terminal